MLKLKEMTDCLLSQGWVRTSLSFSTLEKERPDLSSNSEFFWFKEGKYLTVDLTIIPSYNWLEPTKQTKYFTLEEAYDSESKN